jgi:nucleotide-binding universal stress UspA family protein
MLYLLLARCVEVLLVEGRERDEMFQKILVAYDGSIGAKRALDVALSLASLTDAEVWTLAVEEHLPRFAATVDETEDEKAFADDYYETCLSAAFLHALQAGITVKTIIRAGAAARTIIDVAREEGVDLVVLGRSHRTGIRALFPGTTTQKVCRGTPCCVLLV